MFTAILLNFLVIRVNIDFLLIYFILFIPLIYIQFILKRFPEMDRIRRRQIGARPFLRSAHFKFRHNWNSDSVRFGAGERRKRHEFADGEIHGTATGNLFFLVHGNGGISNFNIYSCGNKCWSYFERGSNRIR